MSKERIEIKRHQDTPHIDVIDLVCQFTEHLEFNCNDPDYGFLRRRMEFLQEEVDELSMGITRRDDVEIVDGAMDTAFVALGQAYITFRKEGFTPSQSVVKTRSALLEVAKTNMMKNPPTEKSQKITKPEGWEPPAIAALLVMHKKPLTD